MAEPKWLTLARAELGTKEGPGAKNNPKVLEWFKASGHGWIKEDSTAWCAAFVGAMLEAAGQKGSGSVAARSYLKWGKTLSKPVPGAITVFKRGNASWQGHVAFFLRDLGTHIEVLGGNQSDSVSIARYKKADLLGYRWPDTIAGSKVMLGSTGGLVGGSGFTADAGMELIGQLNDADAHLSAGTVLSFVIGLAIVGFCALSLYSRWDAGGRTLPSFTPNWLRNWLERP